MCQCCQIKKRNIFRPTKQPEEHCILWQKIWPQEQLAPYAGQIGNFFNNIHRLKTLLVYSLPIFGSEVLRFLAVNIDYYLVLTLSGLFTAGVYSPAVLIGSLYLMIVVGAGETLLLFFSRIYGRSGISSLNDLSNATSRYVFLIYFPLGFAIFASCPSVIILIFGGTILTINLRGSHYHSCDHTHFSRYCI